MEYSIPSNGYFVLVAHPLVVRLTSDTAPRKLVTMNVPMTVSVNASDVEARLLDLLIERGVIDDAVAERARRAARTSRERIDVVLIRLGLVAERPMAEALAKCLGFGLFEASDLPVSALLTDQLPADYLRRCRALPVGLENGELRLAMADPLDQDTAAAVEFLVEHPVVRLVATPSDLEAAFDRLFGEKSDAGNRDEWLTARHDDANEGDAARLKDLASEAPIIRLVEETIARAVDEQASDIHFEPGENAVRVRFRRDGALSVAETLPLGVKAAVISRIKIMARLNIAERRMPQDGRIRLAVRGRDIDMRVSTMPTMYGESVVLRILDRSAQLLDLDALGLSAPVFSGFRAALEQPNGIVLVTGPTGSGKTTTLCAGLSRINQLDTKLFTVEDPIEYHLEGINQIQVNARIGLTFATALRSILRQDPDIVMIGEIRDLETAEIAVQASLTGHLVLSTVHTNSAAATITRLVDMGVERYLLASSLTGILAQRLVRRLCGACAIGRTMPPVMLERLVADAGLTSDATVHIRQPKGCAKCRGTGYSGRTAIAELMPITDEVRGAIVRNSTEREIEDAGLQAGMVGMYRDGLTRVLTGETTIEEVLQATRIR